MIYDTDQSTPLSSKNRRPIICHMSKKKKKKKEGMKERKEE